MKRKFNKNNSNYSLAHVLYQKLGSDWYAFTEVDGDCFMTKVSADTVHKAKISNSDAAGAEDKHGRAKRKAA